MLAAVGGFALFWACFFTMLMRNAFLDLDIDRLWYHLVLRIAFFLGFGACAFAVSRLPGGIAEGRAKKVMAGFVILFAVVAAVSSASYALLRTPHPLAFDLAVWGLSGVGLGCLLFLWIPALARMERRSVAICLTLSAACGGFLYLVINLLPASFDIVMLIACALTSLAIRAVVAREEGLGDEAPIAYEASKRNARLSWSFGIIYVVYGIVIGLGTGSVTQIPGDWLLFAGIASFILIGAGAAFAFLHHLSGRIRQSDVLRMLFPFLVVSLVPMAFFTGLVYALCNLLLLASYVFLVMVSLFFEVQAARDRSASPLYFVGMSQTALSVGVMAGFALGLLASAAGAIDYGVLSAVALGLVVLLAIFVTFAPVHDAVGEGRPERETAQGEHPEQGRWRTRCAAVAQEAGLSARETEVFYLLAKGRGIEHIQNKLCISSHTVKSHTYNIYRKMGINSREELLDAIEAAPAEEEA